MKPSKQELINLLDEVSNPDVIIISSGLKSVATKLLESINSEEECQQVRNHVPGVSNLLCGSFEPDNKTSSATKCKCGREKWEHPFNIMKIKNENLLPSHYKAVDEPGYHGRGNHSVNQLEDICEQYKELVHQLRIREQRICEIAHIKIK